MNCEWFLKIIAGVMNSKKKHLEMRRGGEMSLSLPPLCEAVNSAHHSPVAEHGGADRRAKGVWPT